MNKLTSLVLLIFCLKPRSRRERCCQQQLLTSSLLRSWSILKRSYSQRHPPLPNWSVWQRRIHERPARPHHQSNRRVRVSCMHHQISVASRDVLILALRSLEVARAKWKKIIIIKYALHSYTHIVTLSLSLSLSHKPSHRCVRVWCLVNNQTLCEIITDVIIAVAGVGVIECWCCSCCTGSSGCVREASNASVATL
jgi:hypothetical protein